MEVAVLALLVALATAAYVLSRPRPEHARVISAVLPPTVRRMVDHLDAATGEIQKVREALGALEQ